MIDDSEIMREGIAKPKSSLRGRRGWFVLLGVGLAVLLLILVLVALLPTLVGTGPGLRFAVGQINTRIPGTVEISELSTGWWGGQRLQGVTLRDPVGGVVLTLKELHVPGVGLWGLARGQREFGVVEVAGLSLDLQREADGRTNLEHALAWAEGANAKKTPETTGGTETEDAALGLPKTLRATVNLKEASVVWREALREPLTFAIATGQVSVEDELSGEIDATLAIGDAMGIVVGHVTGTRAPDTPWTADLNVVGLPLPALDAWLNADGYLVAALGKAADFQVILSQWSPDAGGAITVKASSGAGTGGTLELIDDGVTLRLAAPATFSLVQTPKLSQKIMRLVNPILMPAVISAVKPLTVTFNPETFEMPSRGFAWAGVHAAIHLDVGQVVAQANRPPFDQLVTQLQALNILKEGALYEMDVRPIDLLVKGGTFHYAPQTFQIDDLNLMFQGTMSMTQKQLDIRLVPGGREIERDPLLAALVKQGVRIAGPLDNPVVEMGSVLDGLKEDRLGDTLIEVLGGLLERELQKELQKE